MNVYFTDRKHLKGTDVCCIVVDEDQHENVLIKQDVKGTKDKIFSRFLLPILNNIGKSSKISLIMDSSNLEFISRLNGLLFSDGEFGSSFKIHKTKKSKTVLTEVSIFEKVRNDNIDLNARIADGVFFANDSVYIDKCNSMLNSLMV